MKTKLVRPVLVESKEESHLQIRDEKLYYSDKLFCANNPDMPEIGFINPNHNQQLILISLEDEKIKVGNEFLYEGVVYKLQGINPHDTIDFLTTTNKWIDSDKCMKVIATQSQLSPEYIQQFIEEYNKGEVKNVEIEMDWQLGDKEDDSQNLIPILKPKLTNGYVTIVNTMKAEEKLQQAANSYADNYYDKNDSEQFTHWCNRQSNFLAGAKSPESLEYWKEKEKLWTNEEIEILLGKAFDKAATYAGFSTYYCTSPEKYAKEWFNQHKK